MKYDVNAQACSLAVMKWKMSADRDSDGFPIPTCARQVEILSRAFRIEARVAQHIHTWEDLKAELEERLMMGSKATEDRRER